MANPRIQYQDISPEKKLLGIYVIGWSVLVSNILLVLGGFVLPALLQITIPPKFMQFIAIVAVFPWDCFLTFFREFLLVHALWILVIVLCAVDILQFNKFARMIFIIFNIIHAAMLATIVVDKFGQPGFVDYFFKLYFNLVAAGTYVGFMTIPEVRERFGIVLQESQIRAWWTQRRLREPRSQDSEAYYNLGLAYSRMERYDDAIEALKKAMMIKPKEDHVHYQLGLMYYKIGEFDNAVHEFKAAVRINPVHAQAYYQMGESYRQLGCIDEAIRLYEKIIPFNSENASFYKSLGQIYHSAGKFNEAVEALQKAAEIDSQDSTIFDLLGEIYLTQFERFQEAREALQKSIRLRPGVSLTHFRLGLVHIKQNRFKDAIRCFKETIRIDEQNKDAHYHLGFTYAMIKDYDSARREYRVLKDLDDDLADNLSLLLK